MNKGSKVMRLINCLFIFLIGACGFLFSCQKSTKHHKKTVPLHAEFGTVSTNLQPGPPELDSIAGNGYGTPLGEASFIAHAQFDANNVLTGLIVATGENGDEFFASITGRDPEIDENGNITLHFQATITGGTGKYAGATGSFAGTAHESIYNAAGSATWDGTITY
jgi:hypothetical protein